jgi:hypothetical protein
VSGRYAAGGACSNYRLNGGGREGANAERIYRVFQEEMSVFWEVIVLTWINRKINCKYIVEVNNQHGGRKDNTIILTNGL